MKKADVGRYLTDTREVEGSFFPIDAYVFGMFGEIQKQEGYSGNLFEIGAHQGKTAIFLARMAAPDEIVGVCDVFENGEMNAGRPGEGRRDVFLANIRAHTELPAEQLAVFVKRSALLTADETTTRCRFFHIDGGHRSEDLFADLVTADRAVLADGVVSVDHVFNANWPGVGEGFYNFIATRPGSFAPIFIGGNTVFFSRPDAAGAYERHWATAEMKRFFDEGPFTFDVKDWLGRRVMTAIRSTWVDLDPLGAARSHLGPRSWTAPIKRLWRRR